MTGHHGLSHLIMKAVSIIFDQDNDRIRSAQCMATVVGSITKNKDILAVSVFVIFFFRFLIAIPVTSLSVL